MDDYKKVSYVYFSLEGLSKERLKYFLHRQVLLLSSISGGILIKFIKQFK